jgi:recombination protein RecA
MEIKNEQMSLEDYLTRLDPKTAKRVQTAQEIELVKRPLASIGLTNALNGGIGAGRVTLCYGNTSSGKSVLFQQSIGRIWQPQGLVCAYVDAEGTYEKSWGARLGINNDELILIQSKSSGRIEKEIKPHLEAGIDILVIDSISDILPEVFVDKDGNMNEDRKQLGAHAKAITNLINGIHYVNEKTAVIVLSQTTTKIEQTYVKQVPHGGQKILFSASQIIKLTSSNTDNQQIKGDLMVGGVVLEQPIGRKVGYYVEKNKMGRQSTKGEYDLYYAGDSVGIDTVGEVLDLAEAFAIVEKKGAWYTYEEKQYQGRPRFVEALKADAELFGGMSRWVQSAMTGEAVEV